VTNPRDRNTESIRAPRQVAITRATAVPITARPKRSQGTLPAIQDLPNGGEGVRGWQQHGELAQPRGERLYRKEHSRQRHDHVVES